MIPPHACPMVSLASRPRLFALMYGRTIRGWEEGIANTARSGWQRFKAWVRGGGVSARIISVVLLCFITVHGKW